MGISISTGGGSTPARTQVELPLVTLLDGDSTSTLFTSLEDQINLVSAGIMNDQGLAPAGLTVSLEDIDTAATIFTVNQPVEDVAQTVDGTAKYELVMENNTGGSEFASAFMVYETIV